MRKRSWLGFLFFLALTFGWFPFFTTRSALADAKNGEALFKSKNCMTCHSVGEKGGQVGPALDGVASRRSRTWITDQLHDPKSHKPDAVMPQPILSPEELNDLVDYLLSGFHHHR